MGDWTSAPNRWFSASLLRLTNTTGGSASDIPHLRKQGTATTPVEGGHDHLLQESQIGLPLKMILMMKVDETGIVQTDRSENLSRIALPSRGYLGLTSTPRSGRMQGWNLPKRSLIFE